MMTKREDVNDEIARLAFEFFFRFSRFEFMLKENRFLKSEEIGKKAEPGWDKFISEYKDKFRHTEESEQLIKLNPKQQFVGKTGIEWRSLSLENHAELWKVVRLICTVRNNLFHGGKHGADGWDDQNRTREILEVSTKTLDSLAALPDFEIDYWGKY